MRIESLADAEAVTLLPFRDLTDVALRARAEPEMGIFLAESAKVIRRALVAGLEPVSAIVEEKYLPELSESWAAFENAVIYVGTREVLESVAGFHVHRGAIAAFRRPVLSPFEKLVADARRVVILEDIVDHTNVGAAFRAVAGLGADAVLVTPRCADPLYRRSVRVSMGSVLQVPWTRLPEWCDAAPVLEELGFEIVALALSDRAESLDRIAADPPEKIALLLGSEGDGLSREAIDSAHRVITIPMSHGVDSLNVASACAVALWALRVAPSHSTHERAQK